MFIFRIHSLLPGARSLGGQSQKLKSRGRKLWHCPSHYDLDTVLDTWSSRIIRQSRHRQKYESLTRSQVTEEVLVPWCTWPPITRQSRPRQQKSDEAGSSLGRLETRLLLVVAGSGSPHIFPANYPEDKNMLALIRQPQCKTKSLIIKRLFNIINFQLALRKWCPQKSFHTNSRIDELLKHVVDFQNWLLLMKRMVITARSRTKWIQGTKYKSEEGFQLWVAQWEWGREQFFSESVLR